MAGPGLPDPVVAAPTGRLARETLQDRYINKLDTTFLTPTHGQVPQYDSGEGTYKPVTPAVGGGALFISVDSAPYNAVGNGTTNDHAAFAAATTAAAGVNWVYLTPGKTYALASQWVLPSNTRIWAYGATIKSTSTGTSDRVVVCSDVSNIHIYGLTIDGNKAAFAGATEQRHGFHLIGASNVKLIDVNSSSCKGDGLYLGRGASVGCSNIIVQRSVFNANHRNACSVVDVTGARITDSDFTNTTGTTPQDGIDIEPNISGNTITDITFTGCKISGNTGDGVGFNRNVGGITPVVSNITFDKCNIRTNTLRGVIISYTSAQAWLNFTDCDVASNLRYGYSIEPQENTGDIKIKGGSIRLNQWAGIVGSPATSMSCNRVTIEGVSIIDNSVTGASAYPAIWVQKRCHRWNILGNTIANVAAANQDVPIWADTSGGTATDITYLRIIGNIHNTVGPAFLTDDPATRTNIGNNDGGSLIGSVTYDPPSLAAGVAANTTVTVSGAAVGDTVLATHSSIETAATSWIIYGYVSASSTVRVIIFNATGGTVDLGSGTLRVRVFKQASLT